PDLNAELQLDRLKPKVSRRVLLLQSQQPSWHGELALPPGAPPVCHNLTAYLRDHAEFKDKLSPVALSLRLALPEEPEGLVLYGDTLVQAQVRGTGWGHLCRAPGRARSHPWDGALWVPPSPAPPPGDLAPALPTVPRVCPQYPPGSLL
ncbi:ITA2B protein, partial [Tricholaema leucomelas]|nr:ITA2B protein [Tricholaema leucomelas]